MTYCYLCGFAIIGGVDEQRSNKENVLDLNFYSMLCRYKDDGGGAFSYRCRPETFLFYAHRLFITGRSAANITLAVEVFLLFLFWLYTHLMRKDYSKAFAAVCLVPFALRAAILLFDTAVILAMDFPNRKIGAIVAFERSKHCMISGGAGFAMRSSFRRSCNEELGKRCTLRVYGLHHAERILQTTGCFSFLIGSTMFAAMTVHIARLKTTPPNLQVESLPYVAVVFIICVLSILDLSPPMLFSFSYAKLSPYIFFTILCASAAAFIILCVLMCIVGCCCYNDKQEGNSSDPVIINARSRMFWSIPLMIIAGMASLIDLVGNRSADPYISTISMALISPFLLLCVFLLLPAYRTALFCCFANNRLRYKIAPQPTTVTPTSHTVHTRPES